MPAEQHVTAGGSEPEKQAPQQGERSWQPRARVEKKKKKNYEDDDIMNDDWSSD